MRTDGYCFCELAPLYALDLLSEAERQWVEDQVVADPDLAEELASYQLAATSLPYGVPEAPLPARLKDQLFERLDLNLSQSEPQVAPTPPLPPFVTVRSEDWQWQPHPTPGVMIAIIYADPVQRELVGVLRAEAGVQYPLHRHAGVEELYMLSGDLVVGDEVFNGGDYIRSHQGTIHAPYTTTGCMFFFRTSMDDEYNELVLQNA